MNNLFRITVTTPSPNRGGWKSLTPCQPRASWLLVDVSWTLKVGEQLKTLSLSQYDAHLL